MVVTRIPLENIAPHPALLPPSPAPQTTLHTPRLAAPLQGPLVAMGPNPLQSQ